VQTAHSLARHILLDLEVAPINRTARHFTGRVELWSEECLKLIQNQIQEQLDHARSQFCFEKAENFLSEQRRKRRKIQQEALKKEEEEEEIKRKEKQKDKEKMEEQAAEQSKKESSNKMEIDEEAKDAKEYTDTATTHTNDKSSSEQGKTESSDKMEIDEPTQDSKGDTQMEIDGETKDSTTTTDPKAKGSEESTKDGPDDKKDSPDDVNNVKQEPVNADKSGSPSESTTANEESSDADKKDPNILPDDTKESTEKGKDDENEKDESIAQVKDAEKNKMDESTQKEKDVDDSKKDAGDSKTLADGSNKAKDINVDQAPENPATTSAAPGAAVPSKDAPVQTKAQDDETNTNKSSEAVKPAAPKSSPKTDTAKSKKKQTIPIYLRMSVHGVRIHDDFEFDPAMAVLYSPMDMARDLARDLNLGSEATLSICIEILEQIISYDPTQKMSLSQVIPHHGWSEDSERLYRTIAQHHKEERDERKRLQAEHDKKLEKEAQQANSDEAKSVEEGKQAKDEQQQHQKEGTVKETPEMPRHNAMILVAPSSTKEISPLNTTAAWVLDSKEHVNNVAHLVGHQRPP